jgi:branched-chain amino acid transport system permease protein
VGVAEGDTKMGNLLGRSAGAFVGAHAGVAAAAPCALLALVFPHFGSGYLIYVSTLIFVNAIAAQGLNFLIGYTGQISLGHGAFLALGAYSTAIMCGTYNCSFWTCFVSVPVVTGIIGIIVALPALRLTGLYLAMVTLAFHMVVSLGLMSLDNITGGYQGMDVLRPHIGTAVLDEVGVYYLSFFSASVFLALAFNLSKSKFYRAFIAIKEKEISAQSMGISLWGYKTLAFFLASVYAGMAGCLFAITVGHVTPNHFPLMVSIEFIMMNIVGGPGSILGILMGTILITILPYVLLSCIQTLSMYFPMLVAHFADIRIIIYGLVIITFLTYIPSGFRGVLARLPRLLDGRAT